MEDRFYDELIQSVPCIPHDNFMCGDVSRETGEEDIIKPTPRNSRFHEIGSDNAVRVANGQGGTQNDPAFDLLIKPLFQLQY
jgi:hypothetical protein